MYCSCFALFFPPENYVGVELVAEIHVSDRGKHRRKDLVSAGKIPACIADRRAGGGLRN